MREAHSEQPRLGEQRAFGGLHFDIEWIFMDAKQRQAGPNYLRISHCSSLLPTASEQFGTSKSRGSGEPALPESATHRAMGALIRLQA